MDIALDTNVLAYAEGVGDAQRQALALALIERLPPARVRLPAQVLGELVRVLRVLHAARQWPPGRR